MSKAPKFRIIFGALKGQAGAPLPRVSRRVRVRGASWAREGVQGLPQHELGTKLYFLIRCA